MTGVVKYHFWGASYTYLQELCNAESTTAVPLKNIDNFIKAEYLASRNSSAEVLRPKYNLNSNFFHE